MNNYESQDKNTCKYSSRAMLRVNVRVQVKVGMRWFSERVVLADCEVKSLDVLLRSWQGWYLGIFRCADTYMYTSSLAVYIYIYTQVYTQVYTQIYTQ